MLRWQGAEYLGRTADVTSTTSEPHPTPARCVGRDLYPRAMSRHDLAEAIVYFGIAVEFAVLAWVLLNPRAKRAWSAFWAKGAFFGACVVTAGLILDAWEVVAAGMVLAVISVAWARSSWRKGR